MRLIQVKILSALLASVVLLPVVGTAQNDNDVLDYYVTRAGATFETRDPLARGVSYSFLATTVKETLNRDGVVQSVDSMAARFYYSFGQLDSHLTVQSPKHSMDDVDLSIPNIFKSEYIYNFFPNDSGGQAMSLGFDSPSAESPLPTGIVAIDRTLYYVRALFMFYPVKSGYDRYTRIVKTILKDGYVFPEEISVSAGRQGILFTEYFRLTTTISDLVIYR